MERNPIDFRWLYKRIANYYWAVPGFACITDFGKQTETGLKDRYSGPWDQLPHCPSVLYVPLVCIKFFLKEFYGMKPQPARERKKDGIMYAPYWVRIIGIVSETFWYYIVSGRKIAAQ